MFWRRSDLAATLIFQFGMQHRNIWRRSSLLSHRFPSQFYLSVSPLLSLRHARCVTVAELCQFSALDLNSPTGPVWQLWWSRSETKHKTLAEMDLAALPDSLPAQGSRETKPWAIRFRKMILRFDWCTDAWCLTQGSCNGFKEDKKTSLHSHFRLLFRKHHLERLCNLYS